MFELVVTDADKWEKAQLPACSYCFSSAGKSNAVAARRKREVKVEHNGISWSVHTLNFEAGILNCF